MTRINALRNILRKPTGPRECVAWGKNNDLGNIRTNIQGNISALVFAAVLIVCSVTVGCSSDKPKPVSSNTQIPVTQTPIPASPGVSDNKMLADNKPAEPKPAPKKVVHKKPATVNYTDKNTGVTFEYPRRYAIETGDAVADVLMSSPVPMNFVAPGGVALAAVELPESIYTNTDFSSAFFDVSVHKNLTADQCNEFAVPQPKVIASAVVSEKLPEKAPEKPDSGTTASQTNVPEKPVSESKAEAAQATSTPSTETAPSSSAPASVETAKVPETQPAQPQTEPQGSKLLVGDMELLGTEAVSGEGTRQSDSKYFHVYQNGACYEFAMNVTTVASQDGMIKHVDRDKVFARLGQILDTVKIVAVTNNPAVPETAAEAPKAPAPTTAPETAAQ
jgi:hypothetical protein